MGVDVRVADVEGELEGHERGKLIRQHLLPVQSEVILKLLWIQGNNTDNVLRSVCV